MTERKAKSPYQRYQKQPFRYHESLIRWQNAIKRGDKKEAEIHAATHDRIFGVVHTKRKEYLEAA